MAGGSAPSGSGRGKPPSAAHDALAGTRGVANVSHRRTWDEAAYADAAAERAAADELAATESKAEARKRRRAERDPLQQGLIVERASLRSRDFALDLASKAGSRMVVAGPGAPPSKQGGFYCAVCDCTLADSGSYLTHLNGRWHNRALGMSMTVERSTAAEVRDRLAAAAERKRGARRGGGGVAGAEPSRGDELDRQLLLTAGPAEESEEEEEEEEVGAGVAVGGGAKAAAVAGPAPRPAAPAPAPPPPKAPVPAPTPPAADEDAMDPAMAALMGFGGFGGEKKR